MDLDRVINAIAYIAAFAAIWAALGVGDTARTGKEFREQFFPFFLLLFTIFLVLAAVMIATGYHPGCFRSAIADDCI